MKRVLLILIIFLSFSNCSLDTKTGIWTNEENIEKTKKGEIIIFNNEELLVKEFNTNLKLQIKDLDSAYSGHDINSNNSGLSNFDENIKKYSKFKFKKIKNFNQFDPDLISDGNNLVFIDGNHNLLKFDKNLNLIWKKNLYSKKEKKNNPFISMALSENALIVADTIGKLFKIDFNSGKEIWNIKNPNPFNSQVKIYKDKVFIIDLNNVLRCFNISKGEELWKFNSENVFLKSNKRKSLAIKNDVVYFANSLGDIIAVNANNGNLIWQLPTQNSMIYENSFSLKVSDLVIFENDIFFSNNKNEFYSINLNNGFINWKQNINSNIKPIIVKDFIFSISNDGYLFVVDRNNGNIIRITDIFELFKIKERKDIFPVGFIAGNNKLFVSISNGKVIYVDLKSGKSKTAIKLSGGLISQPFVIDSKIFVMKENAVLKLN